MASNDQKLSKFNQAINHYAEEQREKIQQEVTQFKEHELNETEMEVLTEAYRLIQKEMAEMRNGITREMAHREMDARKELLNKRQTITDKVFARAAEQLSEYKKTDKYSEMLKNFAKDLATVFTEPGTVIYLCPADMNFAESVKKAFGGSCSVESDNEIQLGGLRAANPAMGIMADETLDSMLENQREWFEETSGMAVV